MFCKSRFVTSLLTVLKFTFSNMYFVDKSNVRHLEISSRVHIDNSTANSGIEYRFVLDILYTNRS